MRSARLHKATMNMPRALVLLSACVATCVSGATYMWSIFAGPLGEAHSWSSAEVSLAYSGYYLVLCFSSFAAGTLQRRINTNWIILIGGVSYAIAWASLGICQTLPELYLGFSLFGGIGGGFIYNVAVSTATKWFPDKKGFANGLVIGSCGLAPLVFAPLGAGLIEAYGVSQAPLYIGCGMLIAYLAFSWFIQAPPEGYAPEGYIAPQDEPEVVEGGMEATQMVCTSFFWAMLLAFFLCAITGAMITGHAATIGMKVAGITAAQASLQVAALAIGNFCGRFGFGVVSDRIGRCETLLICVGLTMLDVALFMPHATSFAPFAIAMIIVGACYGGVMVVMPSLCSDIFGTRNFGQNYSLIFIGFNVASFIGPLVAAFVLDATGSYDFAFVLAAIFAGCGCLVILAMRRMAKRGVKAPEVRSASDANARAAATL